MKHKIYFKLFDKKMQCTIEAVNKDIAISMLRNKIEIVKIEPLSDYGVYEQILNILKGE